MIRSPTASWNTAGAPRAALPDPGPGESDRSTDLVERICARIDRAGGWLDFSEYMRMALYEPGLGYYDAPGSKFGNAGDFVTAPEISPLFARSIAAQLADVFEGLPARVLEFGAGTGALAQELIGELGRLGCPDVEYSIVEVSADLQARQRERLAGLPVTWREQLPARFAGVILANEVLDVLPVRLFVRAQVGVLERGVACTGGRPGFAGRPADPELAGEVARIEAILGPLPEGYGSEWCALLPAWIRAVSDCLERGMVLLIDYGFPRREYYHAQRTMGTLMCHYRQHAHADPLWLPGLNDITAHVDFTACAQAARDAGLEVLGYTAQAHFLLNCGILDLLATAHTSAQSAAVQRLVSEAEMGELVKVMALGRGIEGAGRGFTRGDRGHRL